MKAENLFIPVAIVVAILLIGGAFLFRRNINVGVVKYLGEVEAISYDAKSFIIKNKDNQLMRVIVPLEPNIADNIGMKVDFSQIKPGSIVEITGSLNEFNKEIMADFIKIGLTPNIIVYKPLAYTKLNDFLLISGEARSKSGEIKIRVKNQNNEVRFLDALKLEGFESFEYIRFETSYPRDRLNLKSEDTLIQLEIFQVSSLDNSEIDLVAIPLQL